MKKTAVAWITAIVGLLIYEGYTLANGTPGDTLSEAVWSVIYEYPLIPFLAGLVMGHFVWQRRTNGPKKLG